MVCSGRLTKGMIRVRMTAEAEMEGALGQLEQ